jgi:RNA polymerase-binding transcription factor DksA
MADDADIANDYINTQVSRALAKLRQANDAKPGSKVCAECGEDIPDARRKLGFKLCVQCAEESERRNSLFANY